MLKTRHPPHVHMQVRAPVEFQGTIIGDLNRRKGVIQNSDSEADEVVMQAHVRPVLQPVI